MARVGDDERERAAIRALEFDDWKSRVQWSVGPSPVSGDLRIVTVSGSDPDRRAGTCRLRDHRRARGLDALEPLVVDDFTEPAGTAPRSAVSVRRVHHDVIDPGSGRLPDAGAEFLVQGDDINRYQCGSFHDERPYREWIVHACGGSRPRRVARHDGLPVRRDVAG